MQPCISAFPRLGLAPAFVAISACCQTWSTWDGGDALTDVDVLYEDMPVADEGGTCPAGLTNCSGVCADLSSDPSHCGSCGNSCADDEVCSDGECTSRCSEGEEECDGACVDLMTNDDHCGSCNHPCAENERCEEGTCECVPDCIGRTCGPDGCGGTCPPGCRTGYYCNDVGICICESGVVCGPVCCPSSDMVCYEDSCCTPDCSGRVCGSDSCGGECEPGCEESFVCTEGGVCEFDELVFEAEGAGMGHNCGRAEADGWSAATGLDEEAHMLFGPYTTDVPGGSRTATFRMMLDNTTADNGRVVNLDVHDFTTMTVLSERDVRRTEFSTPFVYQDFSVSFTAMSGHSLEFRVWWTDISYVRIDKVIIR